MTLTKAPKRVAPARLFRVLAGHSPPRWPLVGDWWRGASGLFVHGLRGADFADCFDGDAPAELRDARAVSALMAATVHDASGARVWQSRLELDESFTDDQVRRMWRDVSDALDVCSPIVGRVDLDSWRQALGEGATHPSNATLLRAVDASRKLVPVMSRKPIFESDPQAFFGLPLSSLTDGQWIAYDAALRAIDKRI